MSFEEVCEFCPFPSNKQKQFGVILFERYNPLLPQRLPGAPNSGTWDGSLKTKDHWAWSWTFCCHCSILKDMNSHSLQLHKIERHSSFFFGTFKSDPSILEDVLVSAFVWPLHKGLRTPPQVVILRGLGTIDLDPYEGQVTCDSNGMSRVDLATSQQIGRLANWHSKDLLRQQYFAGHSFCRGAIGKI